jgi:hypothetical protein
MLFHQSKKLNETPIQWHRRFSNRCSEPGKGLPVASPIASEKVDWTVSTSWNIGRMCHFKNYLVRALRNAVLKKALSSGGEKQIKKLYSIA